MVTLALLGSDLNVSALPGVDAVRLFRLVPSEQEEFQTALPDLHCFVTDLNLINVDSFRILSATKAKIAARLEEGSLLLCFTSRPSLHSPDGLSNKYSWLPFFDSDKQILEDLVDKIRPASGSSGTTQAFEQLIDSFYATCSFPDGFGSDPYEVLLQSDETIPVALAKQVGKGWVLLVPQSEEKPKVLECAISWWQGNSKASTQTSPEQWAAETGQQVPAPTSKESSEASNEQPSQERRPPEEQTLVPAPSEDEFSDVAHEAHDDEDVFTDSLKGLETTKESTEAPASPQTSGCTQPGYSPADEEMVRALKVMLGEKFARYDDRPLEELRKIYESHLADATKNLFETSSDDLENMFGRREGSKSQSGEEEAWNAASPDSGVAPPPPESAPPEGARGEPDWLVGYKSETSPLSDLIKEAEQLESEAAWLLEKAQTIRGEIAALNRWDSLLFEEAEGLHALIKDFFREVLGAKTEAAASPDGTPAVNAVIGEQEFCIHLVTSQGQIPESAGRELMRHLADAPADTKGVLLVNGALGSPPPAMAEDHVQTTLIKLAKKRGLVIVTLEALYQEGLRAQRQSGWNSEGFVKRLAENEGPLGSE